MVPVLLELLDMLEPQKMLPQGHCHKKG